MKMFLRKKVRQMLLLIVQTPHKTFMIKYYDNNLKKIKKKKKQNVSYKESDNILNSFILCSVTLK